MTFFWYRPPKAAEPNMLASVFHAIITTRAIDFSDAAPNRGLGNEDSPLVEYGAIIYEHKLI